MENLEGKFKAYDASRRRDAANASRLSETKNKLIYNAERELHTFLKKERVEGVSILSTHIDELEITQSEESGAEVLTGKVIATINFIDKGAIKIAELPISIIESQVNTVKADIASALAEAVDVEKEADPLSKTRVTASKNAFKIVDDGTKYFKIYHTAAYGDLEPIGAVSKDEYEEATSREELLMEMFQDEALAWPAEVDFIGEFIEPEIIEAVTDETPQYVVHAPKVEEDAEIVEENAEVPAEVYKEADKWHYKITNADRLAREATEKNFDALRTRLTQRALASFNDAWSANHLGNINIKDAQTVYDEASGIGKVTIEAEVLDGKDTKLVPFVIDISGNSMKLPDFSNIASLLKEAKVVGEVASIKKEASKACAKCKKTNCGCGCGGDAAKCKCSRKALKKKATPMAPANVGYQEVLRMPKDFLPSSLKEGDIIEVDGLKWRLSSKSEGQLSKERDTGSHWTFTRAENSSDSKYRQDSY